MKRLLVVFMLFGALSVGAFAEKIAKVNTIKLFSEFSKTKVVNKEIEAEVEKVKKEIKTKEEALVKEGQELDKKGTGVTKEEQKKFEDKVTAFHKYVETSSKKIAEKEEKALIEITGMLEKAIEEVAKEGSYDLVFKAEMVVVGGEDITDKVQKKLEAIAK